MRDPMIVRCPSCQTRYRIDPSRLRQGGGRLRCVKCRAVFPIEAAADDAPGPGPAPALPAPAPPAAGPPGRLDVAVVGGPAAAFRQQLAAALGRASYRTILVEDGPACLETVRRSRPRLLAVAHALPGLTGSEIIEAVRSEPSLAAMRILAWGGPDARGRHAAGLASLLDADAHLPEDALPRKMDEVLATLGGRTVAEAEPGAADDARRLARVAVQDLLLYQGDEVEAGLKAGRYPERVADYLADARLGCILRHPLARFERDTLAAFDDEMKLALSRRRKT